MGRFYDCVLNQEALILMILDHVIPATESRQQKQNEAWLFQALFWLGCMWWGSQPDWLGVAIRGEIDKRCPGMVEEESHIFKISSLTRCPILNEAENNGTDPF